MTDVPPIALRNLKTSVVICTCNGASYVVEQFQSILGQSRIPDEIILGDDASTDETWSLVQAFVAQARSRGIAISATRNAERLGYVGNFSRALSRVSGQVVFLCDQDDAWHPDKIATMLGDFERDDGLTFLHSDARLVDREGNDLGYGLFDALEVTRRERTGIRQGDAFAVYLRRNLATGAASAFRSSLLELALPLPPDWVHDAWLATLAAASGRLAVIDDALVDYRQHGANQIGIARRTAKRRLSDMFRSRSEAIRKDAERMDVLINRLRAGNVPVARIALAEAMRAHLRVRLVLSARPLVSRLPSVAREWVSGRYARFGTGARSAIRDLLRVGG